MILRVLICMVVVVGEKERRSHVVDVVQHVMLRCMGWGQLERMERFHGEINFRRFMLFYAPADGDSAGDFVGDSVGDFVGDTVGDVVGDSVGDSEGAKCGKNTGG